MKARLAIDGGTPIRTAPLPPWPVFDADDAKAVGDVVGSARLNYWAGSEGQAFEAEYAALLGRAYALAVGNGTVALELALRAFGVGTGDEVIVPARTFIATAGAVVAVGATPVVADIDPDSSCLTVESLREALTDRTRAVMAVHLAGWPVELDPIRQLATARGLVVIEDCAQAHGGALDERPLGSLGEASAFSFCQDKILSVGEGGMLLLDDPDAYERAWSYRDHGKSRRAAVEPSGDGTTFRWTVESFGSNFRLGEMQSALGRRVLGHLLDWHGARTLNASRLAEALRDVPGLRVPVPRPGAEHAFYRLCAYVEPSELRDGWSRDRVAEAIVAEGVPCQYGTCAEIYREKAFAAAGLGPRNRLPVASAVHETALSFFVHPTLSSSDIDDTAAGVRKVMEVAAG